MATMDSHARLEAMYWTAELSKPAASVLRKQQKPKTAVEVKILSQHVLCKIGEGHVVADFGCGPGHAAIEFARRVGPNGHVHALDINAEFVQRAARSRRDLGR